MKGLPHVHAMCILAWLFVLASSLSFASRCSGSWTQGDFFMPETVENQPAFLLNTYLYCNLTVTVNVEPDALAQECASQNAEVATHDHLYWMSDSCLNSRLIDEDRQFRVDDILSNINFTVMDIDDSLLLVKFNKGELHATRNQHPSQLVNATIILCVKKATFTFSGSSEVGSSAFERFIGVLLAILPILSSLFVIFLLVFIFVVFWLSCYSSRKARPSPSLTTLDNRTAASNRTVSTLLHSPVRYTGSLRPSVGSIQSRLAYEREKHARELHLSRESMYDSCLGTTFTESLFM